MRRALESRTAIAVVAALLGAGAALAISALIGGEDEPAKSGQVRLNAEPAESQGAAALDPGVFERAVATVNRELDLPTDLHVQVVGSKTAAGASASGPKYAPEERTVYLPWSFVEQSLSDLRSLPRFQNLPEAKIEKRLGEAMTFVLYHELSHGLIDVLDVPVVTSQEETADSLASVFAIASARGGQVVPLSASALDQARAQGQRIPTLAEYADDHGLDRQRAYNALCLVYGSDPRRYAGLVKSMLLPEARAELCEFDYKEDLRAWRRLLSAHLTDAGGLLPQGS